MSESFSFAVILEAVHSRLPHKYMIDRHTMKVKVFHPDYNEHREVLMKTVSHARITHRGGHNMGIPLHLLQQPECLSPLLTVFSTTVVHHSLLGASGVLQYMYLCIELCIRGWTYICNKHGWI